MQVMFKISQIPNSGYWRAKSSNILPLDKKTPKLTKFIS